MKINFDEFTGAKIKIGVIDTGINNKLVQNVNNAYNHNFKDFFDNIGHGTKVAQIINKLSPECIIYNLKVFDKNFQTTSQIVLEAIEWGIENKLDILNISLGTKDFSFYKKFKEIVDKAINANCFIISAISNDYSPSLPAILDSVIAVGSSNSIIKSEYGYYFIENRFLQCIADGGKYIDSFLEKTIDNKNQTSYAAPIITSIVAKLLQYNKKISYTELLQLLRCNSLSGSLNLNYINGIFKNNTLISKMDDSFIENNNIKESINAYYLQSEKEKYFFSKYNDLLNIKLCEIDLNIDAENNIQNNEYFTQKYNISSESKCDLFIIGISFLFLDESELAVIVDFLTYLISKNIKIYSLISRRQLEKILRNKEITNNKHVIYTTNHLRYFKKSTLEFSNNSEKPILCFVNLSPKRTNTFEIQLLLRRYLLFRKLNFAQISSTIYAELFGMDFVLNTDTIFDELLVSESISYISYLNYHFLSKKKMELLIYNFDTSPFLSSEEKSDSNKNKNSLFTEMCLNTIIPDAFILVVDSYCKLDIIIKNIENILISYEPDFIFLIQNNSGNFLIPFFSDNSQFLITPNVLYQELKRKFKNNGCEFILTSLSENKWKQKIYEAILKHYKKQIKC